jgi:hypothetical protein
MDPEVKRHIHTSIHHWVYNRVAKHPSQASTDGRDCALCTAYYDGRSTLPCTRCPVCKRTGGHHCEGTPYRAAANAFMVWQNVLDRPSATERDKIKARGNWRRAATKEIKFLESLLVERGKPWRAQ